MKTLHKKVTPQLLRNLFNLEKSGKYDKSLAELRDIWNDTTKFPDVEEYESRTAAEIILRCGALIGFLGHNKQIPNSQEKSKNLLTEARKRFLDIYDVEKIAECENYLALAYWRTGEIAEAHVWIEHALEHHLADANYVRLYSHIINGKIDFAKNDFEKVCRDSGDCQTVFLNSGDYFIKGNFYNNWGLALMHLGINIEALPLIEKAKEYFFKLGHHTFLSACENNLAQIYQFEKQFDRSHSAIDNAIKIFKQIKDRTREGFSFDTKAQIYLAEDKYTEALKTADKAISILSKSENKGYLVESMITKAKILLCAEENASKAVKCLFDAVQIAQSNISEEKAFELIEDFEKTRREKISAAFENVFEDGKDDPVFDSDEIKFTTSHSDEETISDSLELLLPPSISHYSDLRGVWIANNYLKELGLEKGSLAIVSKCEVQRGDLVAINECETDLIICGLYDAAFGMVSLERKGADLKLFDENKVSIYGKIIGVCEKEIIKGKRKVRAIPSGYK